MIIGLDFDNTLVNYNQAFYHLALENKLIEATFPKDKLKIRNYLRNIGQEPAWTEMQGVVYGIKMHEAKPFDQMKQCLNALKENGHHLFIISHKTKHPIQGEPFDLHLAAHLWISSHLNDLISFEDIFFEPTKKDKIARIIQTQCDIFIDDLPEIFSDDLFPSHTHKILFDPDSHHQLVHSEKWVQHASWNDIRKSLVC